MKYGIEESLVLDNFAFWCCRNEVTGVNLHDGRYWTHNTQSHLSSTFGLSHRQFRRIIDNLVKAGVLLVGNYNNTKYDRTIWYSVDFDKLASDGFPSIREKTIFKVKERLGIPQDVDINKPVGGPIYSTPKIEAQPQCPQPQPMAPVAPQPQYQAPLDLNKCVANIIGGYPAGYTNEHNEYKSLYTRTENAKIAIEMFFERVGIEEYPTAMKVLNFKRSDIQREGIDVQRFVDEYAKFKAEYESSLPKLRIASCNKYLYEGNPEYNFKMCFEGRVPYFEGFFGISFEDADRHFISKGIYNPPVEYYE